MAEKITAWSLEEAKGIHFQQVLNIYSGKQTHSSEFLFHKVLKEKATIKQECVLIARNNQQYPINKSVAPIKNKQNEIVGMVFVFRDITQNRKLSAQLFWQANHDSLTGLMNRSYFEEKIKEALLKARKKNNYYSLCYLDIDRFKIVNDTCGHQAGDELLRQLATLLKRLTRSTDLVARLGGDEFGILFQKCSLDAAQKIAEKIRAAVEEYIFLWENKSFHLGVSIGLVGIDSHTSSQENILSLVDNACYVAKDKGRNRIYTCHINDQQLLLQRQDTEWTIRINQALEENRFCLHRQAIVEIKPSFGTQSKHYEILLRMKDRNGQEIAPMAFLPAAERYGLMPKIDRWVIQSFFAYFAQENNSHPCCYCLNLSGASINDDQFLDFLEEQLALYQLPTHNLCFEITETVAIANLSKASKLIAHLKELGCYIALDDFGSGMSSFGYLKSIPCDYLKIDGHFVKDIMDDPIDEAMVDCINRMGQLIGVKTIAEFVENEMILQKLANLGVNYAQGYGISRPEILNIPDHN
jgi:diguanylate cyclase (GGDEF)-like protein